MTETATEMMQRIGGQVPGFANPVPSRHAWQELEAKVAKLETDCQRYRPALMRIAAAKESGSGAGWIAFNALTEPAEKDDGPPDAA